jgi:hypothetical protein
MARVAVWLGVSTGEMQTGVEDNTQRTAFHDDMPMAGVSPSPFGRAVAAPERMPAAATAAKVRIVTLPRWWRWK